MRPGTFFVTIFAIVGLLVRPTDLVAKTESYILEFILTQNALPESQGTMNIKVRNGETSVHFRLRGGYPHMVYTIWTVFNLLKEPLPTTGTSVPAISASTRPGFLVEGNGVSPLARLDEAFTAGMGLDAGTTFVTDHNGDGAIHVELDYDLIRDAPVSSKDVIAQCVPGPPDADGTCPPSSKRILLTTTWLRRFIRELPLASRAFTCTNYNPLSDPESGTYAPTVSGLDSRFWQCVDPASRLPRVHRFEFDHFRLAPHPDSLTHGSIGGNATDHFIDMVGRRADLRPKPGE